MRLFKYVSEDTMEKIIGNCSIRFTQPCQLNDPYEMYPIYDESITEIDKTGFLEKEDIVHFLNALFNFNYLCLCLSLNNKSIPMWSHYASEHSGVMLEFNPKSIFFKTGFLYKVPYSNKRPKFVSSEIIKRLANNSVTPEDLKEYCNSIFTKALCWKHEKEVRLLMPVSELERADGTKCNYDKDISGLIKIIVTLETGLRKGFSDVFIKKLEQDTIKSVYFGINTPEELKEKIRRTFKEKGFIVKYYQAELSDNQYITNYKKI